MRLVILELSDSNMAGYEWSWIFSLNRTADRRFTVSGVQTAREGPILRIPARKGLRDGAEIYAALEELVSEASYRLADHDLQDIAKKVGEVDPTLVSDFLNGEAVTEERNEKLARRSEEARKILLRPFRKCIDEYVTQFNDAPGRPYGPSRRIAAKRFIEEYVIQHGTLPEGTHRIHFSGPPMGYSGGEHDFSALLSSFRAEQKKQD